MKTETKTLGVKLPSNCSIVNADTLWKTIKTISGTGDRFTKEQLIKSGLYTKNLDHIVRNLAYLKYLGFLDENRKKTSQGDKNEFMQIFVVKKGEKVHEIMYELKANREDRAKDIFKKLLKNHEIYQVLKKELYTDSSVKTFIDLEHFFKEKIPEKSPQYYQAGGRFVAELLANYNLLQLEGNNIRLTDSLQEPDREERHQNLTDEIPPQKKPMAIQNTIDPIVDTPQTDNYTISINGPVTKSTWIIKNKKQLNVVKSILEMIDSELDE